MGTARVPLYALIATSIFVIAAVLLILFADPGNENVGILLALFVTTLPSLVAAFASERASRDIRNGVVTEKAREGAELALDNKGVTEVAEITQRGQTSLIAMQALQRLLETNTAANVANTLASEANTESRKEAP